MREIDIRQALIERLDSGEPDTRIVEELGLCQGTARVDLAVVNGSIHGYEIKSERDTLVRLPGQIGIYNRALDLVTIVTAPNHAAKISKIVPPWWGIWITVQDTDGPRLEGVREPERNTETSPFAIAQLLWREEALQALIDRGLAKGVRSKPREDLWRRLVSELTLEELGDIVRQRIRCRGGGWRSLAPVR
jgi:hypothetical protein